MTGVKPVAQEVTNEARLSYRSRGWRSCPGSGGRYVVRGPDKNCKVVETRPVDKTVVVVGDKVYVTREEYEA